MSPAEAQIIALASAGVALVIWLVIVPLGLRGIFEALGADRSRAWIPFVNIATVYRLGGQSEFWLIALVIPISSWLGAIVLFVATHRINRRLDRSGWYTVLAVVAWWAWALALGLQRRIDRTGEAEPLIWSAQPRPQTSLSIPADDDSYSAPPPLEAPVSAAGFIAPMPGSLLPDAPAEPPSRDPKPLTFEPTFSAPAAAPVAGEQREAPHLETIESSAQEPQPEASAAPDPHFDDDATIISGVRADATIISARRRPRWWVHTTMGARVELTGAAAILGRRPSPHPLYPGAQLIAVTDDALSVSATHAVLEFVDGEWQVTDLDSTNGVWLIGPDGGETELGKRNRARVTSQFMLGELGVKVVQGA